LADHSRNSFGMNLRALLNGVSSIGSSSTGSPTGIAVCPNFAALNEKNALDPPARVIESIRESAHAALCPPPYVLPPASLPPSKNTLFVSWSTKARRPSLSAYSERLSCLATSLALSGKLDEIGDICPKPSVPGGGT